MYYFWKIIYAIRYWRVWFKPKQEAEAQTESSVPAARKNRIGQWLGYALLVLVPLAIGLGFGYVHLKINRQLQEQEIVAKIGVQVDAKIVGLEIVKSKHRAIGEDKSPRPDTENCFAAFQYSPPRSNSIVRKKLRLNSMTICKTRKVGQTAKAWIVPADTRIFVLEDDRLAPYWYWISLLLFLGFCGIAILILRGVLAMARDGAR